MLPLQTNFKLGRALRTETTFNDTRDFGIGKKLENLPRLIAEVDDRDLPVGRVGVDGGHEVARHLAQQLVARDLLAAVLAQEPEELVGR